MFKMHKYIIKEANSWRSFVSLIFRSRLDIRIFQSRVTLQHLSKNSHVDWFHNSLVLKTMKLLRSLEDRHAIRGGSSKQLRGGPFEFAID